MGRTSAKYICCWTPLQITPYKPEGFVCFEGNVTDMSSPFEIVWWFHAEVWMMFNTVQIVILHIIIMNEYYYVDEASS